MKTRSFAVAVLAVCGHAVLAASEPSNGADHAVAKMSHEQLLKAADRAAFDKSFVKADPLLSLYAPTHSRYLLGNVSQMLPFDLDRDGRNELLVASTFQGDSRTAYSVLQADVEGNYQIARQSDELEQGGSILLSYHLPGTAEPVMLVQSGSALKLISLEDFQTRAVQSEMSWSRQAVLADASGDGVAELVVLDSWQVKLLDPTTLTVQATVSDSGSTIAIGNLDASPDIELLSTTSRYVDGAYSNFFEIKSIAANAATHKKEIPQGSGYSWQLQLFDTNQDGISEILSNSSVGLQVWDSVAGSVKWTASGYSYYDFKPRGTLDYDGNSAPEMVLVDQADAKRVVFLDVANGQQVHAVKVANGSIQQFVALGNSEAVVVANENDYSSLQTVRRVSLQDGAGKWSSNEIGNSVSYIGLAKRHEDTGLLVSITGRYDYYYSAGAHVRIQQQADLSDVADLVLGQDVNQPLQLRGATTADTDGDGNDELIVVARRDYNLVVYVVNLQTLASRWFIVDTNSYGSFGVAAVDINSDGKQEVVIASHAKLMLLDVDHGAILGQANNSQYYGSDARDVVVHDSNGDGVLDVFVAGGQYAASAVSHYELAALPRFVRTISAPTSVRSLTLLDADADGQRDLLMGTEAGKLLRLDVTEDKWLTVADACSGALSAMKALTGDQLLMICGRQAAIYDTSLQAARWVDADLPTYILNSQGIAFDNAPVNKTLYLAGGRVSRVAYLGHVRRPTAHPLVLRTHWRDVLTGSLLVTNPNPELNLTGKLLVDAAAGAVTLANDGSLQFQYTPTGAALTTDEFRYSVTNGYLESEPVTVKIERSNNAPVAFATTLAVKAGQSVSGTVNAKDVDADPLTWQIKSQPLRGVLTVTAESGAFSYTANKDAGGDDSFVVTVSDGVSSTDVELKVSITAKRSSSGGGSSELLALIVMLLSAVFIRAKAAKR